MKLVYFGFQPQLSTEGREEVFRQLSSWSGVEAAGPFDPDSPDEAIRHMAVVRLSDDSDAAAVSRRLGELPGVEYATEPAERLLVG